MTYKSLVRLSTSSDRYDIYRKIRITYYMTVTQYIHNLFQTYNNYPLCAPYIFSINHTPSITISQSYDKRNILIILYIIIHTLIHSIIYEIINMQRTG